MRRVTAMTEENNWGQTIGCLHRHCCSGCGDHGRGHEIASSLFGWVVPASYDEYTALVKSGNVASKHVWRAIKKHRWWKPGYCDLLSYVACPWLFVLEHA